VVISRLLNPKVRLGRFIAHLALLRRMHFRFNLTCNGGNFEGPKMTNGNLRNLYCVR
jgi:hypothetical protein